MNDRQYLLAIDIGTTKVCTIIGLKSSEGLEIIGVGSHPSYGLKKGSVVNIDKTVKSITCSIEEAKLMAGLESLPPATIGIAGNHIYCFNSSGAVPIKGKEIVKEDVDRVIEAAKAVVIPSDREVLHIIPQDFRVDNKGGIKNPVGMCGVRLEANVHIVTGMTPLIQNLTKCVEHAGVAADNIVLQPIASSKSVLSDEEKEFGTILIDVGGGTTDIAIWYEGSLVHSQIVPVGGNHFTNDLAVALKIPHNEAERIKINHGSVIAERINPSAHITVQGMTGTKPREVSLAEVSKILGARAEEILEVVKDVVSKSEIASKLRGGYVITGGGALVKDLAVLAEFVLERPVKVGFPIPFGGMTTIMQDPRYSTVLGLLLEDSERKLVVEKSKRKESTFIDRDIIGRFSDSLKNVFKDIF